MRTVPRLLSALILCVAAASCSSPEPEPAEPAGPTPEQSLNSYASALVAKNPADLSGHEPALLTINSPLSYVLVFKTSNPAMLTKEIGENDQSGYESNLKITERWQAMYCTSELKVIMRVQGIFSAGAHIADTSGKQHSLAICTV